MKLIDKVKVELQKLVFLPQKEVFGIGFVHVILNSINDKMKVIKLVVVDNLVWCCYEARVHEGVNLGDMVEHAVDGLYMSYLQFNDLLKGLVKAMSDNSELN